MRIARCLLPEGPRFGILQGDNIALIEGEPYGAIHLSGQSLPAAGLDWLAPCVPSKAVCVGLNYRDHAQEMGLPLPKEPLLFLKPPTAVIGPGAAIVYPLETQELHYEAELAVVIGKRAKHVPAKDAAAYILGYTCANDVTARDLQRLDGQWTRAKGFDTFLPLGPWIETDLDPGELDIALTLEGACKQRSSTRNLIFDIPHMVEAVTRVMTLLPGDVILTGTPGGIGPMMPGDRVVVSIGGIGALENLVTVG